MNINKQTLDLMAQQSSSDPDTQTAAVIVSLDHFLACGVNKIPDGVEQVAERLQRPMKYDFIEHAERNAIANAARMGLKTAKAKMYLNWFPCSQCAASIISAGIRKIVCDRQRYEERKDDPRYGFANAMAMLTEAGVTVEWL